jgi:SNF2 family DNA or RNA helicase
VLANKRWQDKEGNIPSAPFIIVCPVNLHNQWTREIERFLKRNTFDIFPYVGKHTTRRRWWENVYKKGFHEPHHRIVLATDNALIDDSTALYTGIMHHVEDKVDAGSSMSSIGPTTVFGQKFAFFIMDEAHLARKFNKLHTAVCSLRVQSASMIAMTATPVMTKLQDLWIMGHLLGIPQLFNKEKFDEMKREINRAQAKDRKTERQSESAADQLRGLLAGEKEHNTIVASELVPKLREWIPWLRDAFDKRVIRRTLDSVDYENRPIFGMRPYCEHILLMELRDSEKEILAKLTNQMVEDTPLTTIAGAGKNFYIEFRRGLLHPHMNPSAGKRWEPPKSIDEWTNVMASTKLDTLAKIVVHHMTQDNLHPLKASDDGRTIAIDSSAELDDRKHIDCDRIVIFSAFPSSNAAIRDILTLYGIKSVEFNGKTPHAKRKKVLNEFRRSTSEAGARVLILSTVGAVGLNLACANIMIIVVRTSFIFDRRAHLLP